MTVGIVGLGLIGGSVGLALRQPGRRLVGHDSDAAACQTALDRQCIDEILTLAEVAQADVVFVAVPPAAAVKTLDEVCAARAANTVVTDCTSTKQDVAAWAEARRDPRFVAAHPMAGHEKVGAAYASSWLFRGAKWIVSPMRWTDRKAVAVVEGLIKETGATPVRLDAKIHDRHVAIVSHLPHAMAASLVLVGAELGTLDIAGGSWRDLTRVGGVDEDLWSQIMFGNRVELVRAISLFEGHLSELREALESEDIVALRETLREARMTREKQAPAKTAPERPVRRIGRSKRRP